MAADIFNLQASITLDTSEYEQALGRAESQTNTFADVLKASLASEAIVSGVKKIASVVSGVGKAAYENYAQYEQLAGGSQLMFGDAYDFVAEKARNAYKTVQMSQNDYLQQVNGFATGLKTALGGNAQAAAELADKVITAEADVVAATGNSQEAVQNAFNGIMKSNYTMLDNLQLGITPTKEGFQQLIDTVNEWNEENGKATEYTIDNLADCQAALVDYIEMQGLAGYAANEAAGTIEGSVASMKAAWENLATGMADSNSDMEGLVQDFVDSVVTAGKNIVPRVQQIVTGVGTATVEAISYLRDTNSTIDLVITAIEDVSAAAAAAGAVLVTNMAGTAIANIATIFTANAQALAYFATESGIAAVQEATLNGVFSASEIAVGVLTGKISLATAAQYAWNTAINANPIGLLAGTVAALTIGLGKAIKKHKEAIKELAGEPQTVEEAQAAVEELERKYREAAEARAESFATDAGFGGDTVEMQNLSEALSEAKENLAELQAQEQAAAEEAAEPANVIKAASEEYAAAAQTILEDYQNTYSEIYNGLHNAGSAFTDVVEATEISWGDAQANLKANTELLANMDSNFEYIKQAADDSGVSIDGFSQMLASMSTEDAAGLLAAFRTEIEGVGAGSREATQKFTELRESITAYQEAGQTYSDGLALAVENVNARIQEASDNYAEKVAGLDQEAEALQAATNTMQGLISGISGSTSGVLGQLDSLANQMKSRLRTSFESFELTIHATVDASAIGEYSAARSTPVVFSTDGESGGVARGVPTIIQNIYAPVESEVELAAATEAYFTQARWAF